MKKFLCRSFILAGAFALFVSCEKPPSEAEKNAQVEKEVQARLAAEHQADEQQRLAQQQADLAAREKALADKEAASSEATATPRTTPRVVSTSSSSSSSSEDSEGSQSYETFYRKLEPYGAWRETDDYGFVWQPRQAQSRSWRPYTDGRWAYTDAGWTWVSEEPFGWATYHYGRWTRLSGVGWVWVPGDEWAPAWVSWRTSDRNVGWAPLPPQANFDHAKGIHKWADNYYDIDAGEYVFVPNEDIGAENIQRSVIPVERNVTIVEETTNVTNITYSNTTIVNEGPNYDQLRARSRRPVDRLRLQRDNDIEQNQAPSARISGEVLRITTPRFNARATAAPRTNGPRIERATVDRGDAGGDQRQIERARQKMRSEATPPPDAPERRFRKPAVTATSAVPVAATATPIPVATPIATATAVATVAPVATATPISTPRPTATVTAVATATPIASVPATTPPSPRATGSPRPAFSPRQSPIATAAPLTTPAATPRTTPVATPAVTATPVSTPVATPRMTPIATPASTIARTTPAATAAPSATVLPTAVPSATVPSERPDRVVPPVERRRDETRDRGRRDPGVTPPAPGAELTPVPPKPNRAAPPPPVPPTGESPAAAVSPAPNALIRERARRVQPGARPTGSADPQASPEPPKEP